MKGQVEESLTSNFKIIRQGHVIYFSIFGFYNLDFVENDTNRITLSHLHQKISRLTNNGKNSVFWPPSCTFDVMTYVTWQRQDDVTYAKMCLPSLVTDTMRRFLRLESSKKLQGKTAGGVVTTTPGRPRVNCTLLLIHTFICHSIHPSCLSSTWKVDLPLSSLISHILLTYQIWFNFWIFNSFRSVVYIPTPRCCAWPNTFHSLNNSSSLAWWSQRIPNFKESRSYKPLAN